MTTECPSGRKLSQFVTHHIFCYVDIDVHATVVNEEGVAHKLRRDRALARPGLDRLLAPGLVELLNFAQESWVDERAFLQ